MNDELDPGLRRLFAETAEYPADEAFVATVSARTSRERRIMMVLRPLVRGLIAAAILAVLATALGLAFTQGQVAITAVVGSSPLGWVVGLALALAGAVCVGALAPVVRLARL